MTGMFRYQSRRAGGDLHMSDAVSASIQIADSVVPRLRTRWRQTKGDAEGTRPSYRLPWSLSRSSLTYNVLRHNGISVQLPFAASPIPLIHGANVTLTLHKSMVPSSSWFRTTRSASQHVARLYGVQLFRGVTVEDMITLVVTTSLTLLMAAYY